MKSFFITAVGKGVKKPKTSTIDSSRIEQTLSYKGRMYRIINSKKGIAYIESLLSCDIIPVYIMRYRKKLKIYIYTDLTFDNLSTVKAKKAKANANAYAKYMQDTSDWGTLNEKTDNDSNPHIHEDNICVMDFNGVDEILKILYEIENKCIKENMLMPTFKSHCMIKKSSIINLIISLVLITFSVVVLPVSRLLCICILCTGLILGIYALHHLKKALNNLNQWKIK